LLMCVVTICFCGCNSQIQTTSWIVTENRFDTSDLERAQQEIPFPILMPNYQPENNEMISLPYISGPLKQFQEDNNVEIKIQFSIGLDSTPKAAVMIFESNYSSSLGEPELNPEIERIEIEDISVLKTKDDWSETDAYYSFESNGIFYIVEAHLIPNESVKKMVFDIVESMIKQLK
jgi:hypothetical protein